MSVIRAKTTGLFERGFQTRDQSKNSDLNRKEMQNGDSVLKSYPARVVIELTSACNIRCAMCGRNHADFKPTFFDFDSFIKFEDILYHTQEVALIGWGEPSVHPEFKNIIKYLNRFPVMKFICTNGMLLHTVTDEIFDCKIDLLTISIDGASAKVNNEIRIGSDFERIIKNAEQIIKIKKARGASYPYLSTVSTLMKKNLSDFPNIVKLAAQMGFDEAKAVYLTGFSDEFAAQALFDCADDVKKYFTQAEEIAAEYAMNLKLPFIQGEDEAGDKPHKDCFTAWRDCFISSDGYFRPCMSTPIKLIKITDYKSFFELWNCDELIAFRKNVNTENMPKTCGSCYQASYANWNKRHAFIQTGNEFSPQWG